MSAKEITDLKDRIANVESQVETLTTEVKALGSRQKLTEGKKDGTAVEPASDDELDGQFGNPAVFRDPPKWEGESNKGKSYSECSPVYLRKLAGFLLWKSGQDIQQAADPAVADQWGGSEKLRKRANFSRLDARRALGWADRLENASEDQAGHAAEANDPFAETA